MKSKSENETLAQIRRLGLWRENEEKACQDYAKRLGIEVVRIMGQTNESAKTE